MNIGLYFCVCGESYVSDFPYNTARCLACQSELVNVTNPTKKQLSMFRKEQLKQLWSLFEKVSFDPSTEEISERFLVWLPTTNRFVIWLWFGNRLERDFIDLPGKLVWQKDGQESDYECECGENILKGQACYFNRTKGKVLCEDCGKRQMIDLWLYHGYNNPWIRQADDPFFTRKSFHVCETVEDLIEKFQKGNCCLGQVYIYKNLVFINQVDGGDEWLTIKDYCPFESITFKAVLRQGNDYGAAYIQKLLDHEIEQESGPDYLSPIVQAFV
ncbi:hypothetical protein L1N85_19930 [Paenibacillus alkaliterrae]|uniref:hypothetical protein n=1 Tax=Paenibacillus alkaliterrae TaxID=320909 RepID=UPI001F1C3C38|nr:hypothetical protein [Paenibacillus alkaliterrae]MCF2940664.1 hypothetical protein [Paenibacillus alkaliterrae]